MHLEISKLHLPIEIEICLKDGIISHLQSYFLVLFIIKHGLVCKCDADFCKKKKEKKKEFDVGNSLAVIREKLTVLYHGRTDMGI